MDLFNINQSKFIYSRKKNLSAFIFFVY